MTTYRKITGNPLPEDCLILPLQYCLFGEMHHCVIFAKIEEEMGKGACKRVDKAFVCDILGQIPLPEVISLKGKRIVLYRPRENDQAFINDIIAIVKLSQRQIQDLNLRTNILKIKGHSLYITEEYKGTKTDYSRLLYEGFLRLTPNAQTLLSILRNSLGSVPPLQAQQVMDEVLQTNDLIDAPFMIGDILPFSVHEAFPKMEPVSIKRNVYQMVYTVAAYAAEGIYFRDLQPDNFRVDHKQQVKLSDPSYIDSSVAMKDRFALFIRQTTPEYLPNVFSNLRALEAQEELKTYFGELTESVCIGMIERVLKRIFMPKYMGKNYDNLYQIREAGERIAAADALKSQEDLDLFHVELQQLPSTQDFSQYQRSIVAIMQQERVYPEEVHSPVANLLSVLRKFSCPVFGETGCHTYLQTSRGPVSIEQLPSYIAPLLGISPASTSTQTPIHQSQKNLENTGKLIQPLSKPSFLKSRLSSIDITRRRSRKEIEKKTDDVLFEDSGDVIFEEEQQALEPVQEPEKEKTKIQKIGFISRATEETLSLEKNGGEKVTTPPRRKLAPPSQDKKKNQPQSKISLPDWDGKEGSEAKAEKIVRKIGYTPEIELKTNAMHEPDSGQASKPQAPKNKRILRASSFYPRSKSEGEDVREQTPVSKAPLSHSQKFDEMSMTTELNSDFIEERFSEEVALTIRYIEDELQTTKKLIGENRIILAERLEKYLQKPEEQKLYRSANDLKIFFKKTEVMMQSPEVEMSLLRKAQKSVSDEVFKIIKKSVSQEYKRYFRPGSGLQQKCKKTITNYLLKTAKYRFILYLDLNQDIVGLLPAPGEDIIEFICEHEWNCNFNSIGELADSVIGEALNLSKR